MRTVNLLVAAVVALAGFSCASTPRGAQPDPAFSERIIALERGALDRWGRGDPQGYIEVYAPEITYFDPFQPARVDGIDQMKKMLEPIAGMVRISRYEMIKPRVQRHGNVAILSFQLNSYTMRDGQPLTVRWNSTAVYARVDGQWRSVHSHWSFTGPPSAR
jgi:ketosteroid isomerase-like protein